MAGVRMVARVQMGRALLDRPVRRAGHNIAGFKPPLTKSLNTSAATLCSPIKDAAKPSTRVGKVICAENQTKQSLDVTWDSSEVTSYPFVYLRDNCPCPQCFHPTSMARAFLMKDLDLDVRPIKVTTLGSEVSVVWSDGHHSSYPVPWLRQRAFTKAHHYSRIQANSENYRLWTQAEISKRFHRVEYSSLFRFDNKLHEFMSAFLRDGIAVIENAPDTPGIVEPLLHAVGFPRATHYGPVTSHVKTKTGANNLAYTSKELELHIDVPLHLHIPGIQFLHCIRQHRGDGGDSTLVDGFSVARQLKEEHPESYMALVTTPVVFEDRGTEGMEFYKILETRTLQFDDKGNLHRINFNNFSRSSFMPMAEEQVAPLYRALKKFCDYCYLDKNIFTYKMKEGEILAMNNLRVLHGRKEFTGFAGEERYLEAGYVDWDEFLSRYRVLSRRIENKRPAVMESTR